LSKLENIPIAQIAKYNIKVFKELQNSTNNIEQFNNYLESINSFVSKDMETKSAPRVTTIDNKPKVVRQHVFCGVDQSSTLEHYLSTCTRVDHRKVTDNHTFNLKEMQEAFNFIQSLKGKNKFELKTMEVAKAEAEAVLVAKVNEINILLNDYDNVKEAKAQERKRGIEIAGVRYKEKIRPVLEKLFKELDELKSIPGFKGVDDLISYELRKPLEDIRWRLNSNEIMAHHMHQK